MERLDEQTTMTGPTEWVTGDVYFDPLATGHGTNTFTLGSVHFTPCAHIAWHRHSIGQTLYCTESTGGTPHA